MKPRLVDPASEVLVAALGGFVVLQIFKAGIEYEREREHQRKRALRVAFEVDTEAERQSERIR